jgi:parallel beta-helix repeat protein
MTAMSNKQLHRYRALTIAACSAMLMTYASDAATYYVANTGNNLAAGTSESAPLATLSFAKTKLRARDTLLLRRGDVFRDSLNLAGTVSDPVIAAWGLSNLALPVISGSVAIGQWSRRPGSSTVWTAPCSTNISNLFVNDTMMTLARYPDTGWLRIDTMTENNDGSATTITVAALSGHPRNAANYWTNAHIRWRRWSWWYETRRITSSTAAGVLALEGSSIIHIMGTKGWGFYIDRKLEELDAPGEWYYDSTARAVYLYPPANRDPNTLLVEGACRSTGLELAGATVRDIHFSRQTLYGLSMSKKSTIERCRFEWIGGDKGGSALRATWDIADSRITGNVFRNNLNIGISWYENSGRKGATIIDHDTLINTGTFPGYGGSGTWHAVGILVHLSANVRVRYNYIDKTGYAGILLGSENNFVEYNIIKAAMSTLNDGGAIYTDCSRSTIRNNIIYDTEGDLESSGPWYPLGHGIWLEFLGDYRESVVENNTIVRSGCNGIYLPNNFGCTIAGNVLFDNAVAQLSLSGEVANADVGRTANLPQNNRIERNVCYATTRRQMSLEYRPEYDYGSMNANYFCNPYTDSVVSGYGTGNRKWTITDYTLGQWAPQFAWTDKAAVTDPIKRPAGISADNPYGLGRLFVNESPDVKEIALGPAYKDLDGNAAVGLVTLAPFSSKVLVQNDSTRAATQPGDPGLDCTVVNRAGGCSLRFHLALPGAVALALYNPAGRLVYRLTTPTLETGTHAFDVGRSNGPELRRAAGVYLFEVRFTDAQGAITRRGRLSVVR